MNHFSIGVSPPSEPGALKRLFKALEEAFPVRFKGVEGEEDWAGLEGLVSFHPDPAALEAISAGPRRFAVLKPEKVPGEKPERVAFGDSSVLDERLRGLSLLEEKARISTLPPTKEGDEVLASVDGKPVWISRGEGEGRIDLAAAALEELGEDECLWEQLRRGRFIGLLPLVHFLREVTARDAWTPPPQRASLIVDDPNLHGTTYGYVDFRKMAEHAEEHNYHAAMAMAPLDAWYASPRAVRIFQEKAERLSLLVHGNNHCGAELAARVSVEEATRFLAQAMRRIENFEKKYKTPVSRVIAPPHGSVSEPMVRAMPMAGFEGLCLSGKPCPWLMRPPADRLTAGWHLSDMVVGGFPVIPRHSLHLCASVPRFREDLALQNYLGRPLIVTAHHDDFKKGLDVMANVAEWINSLGDVKWRSIGDIARSNYLTRREGGLLRVRLFSRRAVVEVPEGVERVAVEKAPLPDAADDETLVVREKEIPLAASKGESAEIAVPDSRRLEVALKRADAVDPYRTPRPARRLWAVPRRLLCEARDRLAPVLKR